MIQAQAKSRPLRKKNQIPSGGTIMAGMPAMTQRQETLRRSLRRPSSSVPRMAETMLTELTCSEEKTTVRKVITTPRQ